MKRNLRRASRAYLNWLGDWYESLEPRSIREAIPEPDKAAVMCVNLVGGICRDGPLASPRAAAIVPNVVRLLEKAAEAGVKQFLLFQDAHPEDATEFLAYGPHCRAGTPEAQTAPELLALPFSKSFKVVPKNSLSPAIGTGLDAWLETNREIDRFIVCGAFTDLGVGELALHLMFAANAANMRRSVTVPADCVQTYDIPVKRAKELGVLPHEGDFLQAMALYQLALSGVRVVSTIA